MAAVSSQHPRRNDDESWEHRSNRSEEFRQNFSLPKTYGAHSPPQTPLSPEEFVTPNSSHFPNPDAEPTADYSQNSYLQNQGYSGPSSDRPVDPYDPQRRPFDYERSKSSSQTYDMPPVRPKQQQRTDGPASRGPNTTQGASRSGKRVNRDRDRDNSSNWVHREKLIALEIQDHIDRGQKVPQALLDAHAASGGRISQATAVSRYELTENNLQRHTSPSSLPDDYREDEEIFVPEDPRTPEEIAAEAQGMEQAHAMYHSPALRSSSSRIPVSKASPYPVPQEHLERSMPLARKRSASMGLDGDGSLAYPRTRSRSQSIGSQVVIDDTEPMPEVPSSPGKLRQASKSTPRTTSTGERKASYSKARSPSSGHSARPPTHDRPRTAVNRPEEPAPWLADMYKPDPLLPPDQQIIPTHAKRLMQEQIDREQTVREQQDRAQREQQERAQVVREQMARDHRGYDPHRSPGSGGSPQAFESPGRETPRRGGAHPDDIGPAPPEKFGPPLPGTPNSFRADPMRSPGSEHGGYSTMPKVQEGPVITTQSMRMQQPLNIQDPDDEVPEKKGCGCCTVM